MLLRILIVLLLSCAPLSLLSCGSLSVGQASSSQPADAKVTLHIEATKATFEPGEPVRLKVGLQNDSNSGVVIFSGPPGLNYKMSVTREDSATVKSLPALIGESRTGIGGGRMEYLVLAKKNGKEEREFDLTTYFDMAKPGKYKIVLDRFFRYEGEAAEGVGHKATSNELTISMGVPKNKISILV